MLTGDAPDPPIICALDDGDVPVHASSYLRIGQALVAVNGVSAHGHEHGQTLLRHASGLIDLTLSRDLWPDLVVDAEELPKLPTSHSTLGASADFSGRRSRGSSLFASLRPRRRLSQTLSWYGSRRARGAVPGASATVEA